MKKISKLSGHHPEYLFASVSLDELLSIPGIGGAVALKLLHKRSLGMTSTKDFIELTGLGKGKLEILKKYLIFELPIIEEEKTERNLDEEILNLI